MKRIDFAFHALTNPHHAHFITQKKFTFIMSTETIRIVCQEHADEVVNVQASETAVLIEKNDYFRAMCEHGTIETGTRTIHKPEWTKETAEHIVRLICKSSTNVKNMAETRDLLVASNEILLDTEIYGNSKNLMPADEQLWLSPHLWTLVWKHSFFASRVTIKSVWAHAQGQGIIMIPSDGLPVHLKKAAPSRNNMGWLSFCESASFRSTVPLSPPPEFAIHAQTNVPSTIFAIANLIRNQTTDKKVFQSQSISMRFPLDLANKILFSEELISTMQAEFKLKGYLHSGNSPGFYLSKGDCFYGAPTFSGSYEALYKIIIFLDKVKSDFGKRIDQISLRLTAPSETSLQNFIDATHSCETNPSTLGVDADTNAYFAIKNRKDMRLMLEALAKPTADTKKKSQNAPFQLMTLFNKRGIF